MKSRFGKKAVAVGAAGAMTLGAGVAAFAYWTATGTGDGSATTTSGQSVAIAQTSTITDLEPGNTWADTLVGTLTVSNGKNAYVNQITASVASTSNPGCTAADFTVLQPSAYAAEVVGSDSGVVLGGIVFNDTTANQDACKGVTVTMAYTSN